MKDIKLFPLHANVSESDFPRVIERRGWSCIRLIKKNYKQIALVLQHLNFSIDLKKIEPVGRPDYFIWKNKRFYFCEFKSVSDSLSTEQLNWMSNHINLPIAVAFVNLQKRNIHLGFAYKDNVNEQLNIFLRNNARKIFKSSSNNSELTIEEIQELISDKFIKALNRFNFELITEYKLQYKYQLSDNLILKLNV